MATITKKDLTDELAEFGVTVDDEAVLEKRKMLYFIQLYFIYLFSKRI